MSSTQIVVKRLDGRWTIGREGWPFQAFPSKEAALERGRILVRLLDYAELVVEDEAGSDATTAPRDVADDRSRHR